MGAQAPRLLCYGKRAGAVLTVGFGAARLAAAMERVRGMSLDRVVGNADDFRARLALLPHVIAVAEAIAYARSG